MLMNMKDLLAVANQHTFAVPAFNIGSAQILNAVIECCEENNAPVILEIHPDELEFQKDPFLAMVLETCHQTKIPTVIHLDHGSTIEQVMRAVRTGFTSVMIDASHMSFEDNIAITKQVVGLCHPLGVSVEAELGTIGALEGNMEGVGPVIIYTDPADAVTFVERTGVDTLAIAIGTAHGLYPKGFDPHLKLDLLSELKSKVSIPLVLHGGSGNPDAEIAEGVKRGINKINISSDIKDAFYQQVRKTLANPKLLEPNQIYVQPIIEMKKVIAHKLALLETVDKAKYY